MASLIPKPARFGGAEQPAANEVGGPLGVSDDIAQIAANGWFGSKARAAVRQQFQDGQIDRGLGQFAIKERIVSL
jgi:hypothetical protein